MSLIDLVRDRGPLTVAAFMDLALYDPSVGYYARAVRRSGRAGDFFTSVDVGPLFGGLLAEQIAEMADLLSEHSPQRQSAASFDLVEAGTGNGRLSADVLNALKGSHASIYEHTRLHLVERSPAARAEHASTLGGCADRLASSAADLPRQFEGVLFANELLDAMPVHQVVMRPEGLREVYVTARGDTLATEEGPPSRPDLDTYLRQLHVGLEPGWRAEIGLAAIEWVRDAADRMRRGFIMLIDYGHEAQELYSASHSAGTLTTFSGHRAAGSDTPDAWLQTPGEQDITSHVDFTSVRNAFKAQGLTELGFLDQTYFLMGIMKLDEEAAPEMSFRDRLALKTLLMPGGLGSTMKVLLLGKGVGTPKLRGTSSGTRVT